MSEGKTVNWKGEQGEEKLQIYVCCLFGTAAFVGQSDAVACLGIWNRNQNYHFLCGPDTGAQGGHSSGGIGEFSSRILWEKGTGL